MWTDVHPGAEQPGPVGDLVWAQQRFVEMGACSEHLTGHARPARDDEPTDPAWSPLIIAHDRERSALLASIRSVFHGVVLGEGRSLDDADAEDFARDDDEPRRHERWTDVTDEEIVRFDAFPFLDAAGFRFYAPAFMVHLLTASPAPGIGEDQFFMFTLARGRSEEFELFDHDQLACVRAFLEFVGRYHPQCYGDEVRQAIERGL